MNRACECKHQTLKKLELHIFHKVRKLEKAVADLWDAFMDSQGRGKLWESPGKIAGIKNQKRPDVHKIVLSIKLLSPPPPRPEKRQF